MYKIHTMDDHKPRYTKRVAKKAIKIGVIMACGAILYDNFTKNSAK